MRSFKRPACHRIPRRAGLLGLDFLRECSTLVLMVAVLLWCLAEFQQGLQPTGPAAVLAGARPINELRFASADNELWLLRFSEGLFRYPANSDAEECVQSLDDRVAAFEVFADETGTGWGIVRHPQLVEVYRNGRREIGQQLSLPETWASSIAQAEDGRLIVAATSSGRLFQWKWAGHAYDLEITETGLEIERFQVSRDGRQCAVVAGGHRMTIWDFATHRRLATWTTPHAHCTALSWSPVADTLATVGVGGQLCVWHAATGQIRWQQEVDVFDASTVVFAPDGTRVVTGGMEGCVRVWDAANGELCAVHRGHQRRVRAVVCHPAGRTLYSAGIDGHVREWPL